MNPPSDTYRDHELEGEVLLIPLSAEGRTGYSRFVVDLVRSGFWRVGGVTISILSNLIVSRRLGPTGKGQYITELMLIMVIAMLIEFGLRRSAVLSITKDIHSWPRILTTILVCYVITCAIGLPLVIGLLGKIHNYILPDMPFFLIVLAIPCVPLFLVSELILGVISGQREVHAQVRIQVVSSAFSVLLLGVFLGARHAGVYAAILILFATHSLTIILSIYHLLPVSLKDFRLRPALVPGLLRLGIPMQASYMASMLNLRLDFFIIFHLLGSRATGLYSIATLCSDAPLFLPGLIQLVLYPHMGAAERSRVCELTRRLSLIVLVFLSVFAAVLLVFGRFLLRHCFGPSFLPAYPALVLLLPGMMFLGQQKLFSTTLSARMKPRSTALAAWLALGVTLLLDVILIPKYGIAGAAAASSIAYGCALLILFYFFSKLTGVRKLEFLQVRRADIAYLIGLGRQLCQEATARVKRFYR